MTREELSASELACYRWPEDTAEHRALREAFCNGARIVEEVPANKGLQEKTLSESGIPNRTQWNALLELLSNAYNEGFSEGMREQNSSKGGWPWSSRKRKYSALLDKTLSAPLQEGGKPT